MDIGKRLKEERLKKTWTQEFVSTQLNVSRSTISSWENGRTYPDLESLVTLSDLYEVSLDILLKGDKAMTTTLTKEIRKGRNRKWVNALLVLVLVPVSFYLGAKYKDTLITYISIDNVVKTNFTNEDTPLSTDDIVEVTFLVPAQVDYSGYTETYQDGILYISFVGVSSNRNEQLEQSKSIKLDSLSKEELSDLEKIVIIDGQINNSIINSAESDFISVWNR